MSGDDFSRLWGDTWASAIKVDLSSRVSEAQGKNAVIAALGSSSALKVQTSSELEAEIARNASQGMARLDQISTLVLIAAILAVVAAMMTSVWQRRPRLADLRAMGMHRHELYRALFLETGVILLIGCSIGAIFGLYGQALDSRWVELSTGFPAPFVPAWAFGLQTLATATLLAVAATALPAYLATRISPGAALADE